MFKLFVTSTNVDSGTIPISWCVSKEALDGLAELREPQVVLCVSPEAYFNTREYRKVVPLRDLMTYVEFRHPGKNRIHGFISFKSPKRTRSAYFCRSYRSFDTSILNYDGDDWRPGWENVEYRDVVSVDVPVDCFAPEPPAWEQAWVNHYFSHKCIDQCQYRRRRILAYTLQPILMILNLLFRMLILTGGLLVGARGVRNWKLVFKPLTYNYKDLFEEIFSGGTDFVRRAKTDEPDGFLPTVWWAAKQCWTVIFMPLLLIPLLIALAVFGAAATLTTLAIGIVATLCLCATIAATVFMIERLASISKNKEPWYTDDEEMLHLVCDGTAKPMKVSRLPRKHRTIKLRLSELKSKICKPFPG